MLLPLPSSPFLVYTVSMLCCYLWHLNVHVILRDDLLKSKQYFFGWILFSIPPTTAHIICISQKFLQGEEGPYFPSADGEVKA